MLVNEQQAKRGAIIAYLPPYLHNQRGIGIALVSIGFAEILLHMLCTIGGVQTKVRNMPEKERNDTRGCYFGFYPLTWGALIALSISDIILLLRIIDDFDSHMLDVQELENMQGCSSSLVNSALALVA